MKNGFLNKKQVFDEETERTLFKLSCRGYFDYLQSLVKVGKEANIFSAYGKNGWLAVKVYRTNANFKKMYEYMAADKRFNIGKASKITIICMWAKKEFRNLIRCYTVDMKVPKPYAYERNTLVIEFIGEDNIPAKQINEHIPNEPKKFYRALKEEIKKMVGKARLIHSDLSEFNILNFNESPVIIDLSHAVEIGHQNAHDFLKRDVYNVVNFFNKLGLRINYEDELDELMKVLKAAVGD